MINIGVKTYDIRDFFEETFVKEYKEVVIDYRKILDTNLPTVKNDGNTTSNTKLIKWIEKRTGEDFSYLYNKGQKKYQYDYKFVKAAYEYLDSINVDETWDLQSRPSKDVILNLSSLSLMYSPPGLTGGSDGTLDKPSGLPYYLMTDKINEVCLKKLIEEFPYMCNSLDDICWKTDEWEGHMIAMPKGAFMSIHRDGTDDRPFTILNYINTDRTLEDGGVYRYFIDKDYDVEDKESLDWSNYPDYVFNKVVPMDDVKEAKSLRYKYHKQPKETQDLTIFPNHNQHDIVSNYTTVSIMLHKNIKTKEQDKKYFGLEIPPRSDYGGEQGIPHMVTKNKSDEVRYTLYRRVVLRDS